MCAKLSQEAVTERIWQSSKNRFKLVSEYKGRDFPVTLHCVIHGIDFTVSGEAAARVPIRCNCPLCSDEEREERHSVSRVELECAYCHKKFTRSLSKANASKSGLHFCCREHKDLAQKINSGKEFESMRPSHYNTGISNYRERAFREYPHKCQICGWEEDEDIL